MIFAGFCIILFQIFAPQLVYFINPEAEAVALGTDFLRIFCLAVPLMIFNIQISFSFQAMGMGKQSLVLSSLRQGLVNIPLLFIMNHFFPLYGIVWTQLISDVVTAIVSYAVYRRSLGKLMTEEKCNSEG
jgi:Na+-driven multidrug efflux pump